MSALYWLVQFLVVSTTVQSFMGGRNGWRIVLAFLYGSAWSHVVVDFVRGRQDVMLTGVGIAWAYI